MTTHDIMRSVNSRIVAKEKATERAIKNQRYVDNLPDPKWINDPPDVVESFDVFVETYGQAEDELRNALDGEGDKILDALELLDLNGAVIQMIIDNAEKFVKEPEKPYGQGFYEIEGLYEKLTGNRLGIKERI